MEEKAGDFSEFLRETRAFLWFNSRHKPSSICTGLPGFAVYTKKTNTKQSNVGAAVVEK